MENKINKIDLINILIKDINLCKKNNYNFYAVAQKIYSINHQIINNFTSEEKILYKEIIDIIEIQYQYIKKEILAQKVMDADILKHVHAPYLREKFFNSKNNELTQEVLEFLDYLEMLINTDQGLLDSYLEYSIETLIKYGELLNANNKDLSNYYLQLALLFVK
jgi:hypothetical protein